MIGNIFSAYIKLEQLPEDVKKRNGIKLAASCPRYDLVATTGYFEPLEKVKAKDGHVHFLLIKGSDGVNTIKERQAETRLQDRIGGNFSSIYVPDINPVNGCFLGYGNPNPHKTYKRSKKDVENPYYSNRRDGFLFLVSEDWKTVEVLIVPECNGGVFTITGNLKALENGEYNEAVTAMRNAAKPFFQY